MNRRGLYLLLVAGLVGLLWGCTTPKKQSLKLTPLSTLYSTKKVEIEATPLLPDDSTGLAYLDGLLKKGYIFIRLSIENKSEQTILYNTSYTFLFAGVLDYKKPIDLTDLYFMVRQEGKEAQAMSTLSELKPYIFDASVRIEPSERVEKLLVFSPLARESHRTRAVLGLNQLYVGTTAIDVRLVFMVD